MIISGARLYGLLVYGHAPMANAYNKVQKNQFVLTRCGACMECLVGFLQTWRILCELTSTTKDVLPEHYSVVSENHIPSVDVVNRFRNVEKRRLCKVPIKEQ